MDETVLKGANAPRETEKEADKQAVATRCLQEAPASISLHSTTAVALVILDSAGHAR